MYIKYSNENNNFRENNQFGFVYFDAALIIYMPIPVCTKHRNTKQTKQYLNNFEDESQKKVNK